MLIATVLATTFSAPNFVHNSGNFYSIIACVLVHIMVK
ncbi:hypothetical protein EGR_11246 [Echinococcus granulosus]|uniref:Uncharacterized protein n=1 Tax=Echinococcus granulosus TaxID=6210 RepID=W6U6C3_ECHGR|nr:hypothetical protein EGR_11246 [Echinococcus granulosus]EUB53897.1 hypothetical protein EGR_11246 [Echinococcus granulosus]